MAKEFGSFNYEIYGVENLIGPMAINYGFVAIEIR